MKKLLAILFVCTLIFSGCGTKNTEKPVAPAPEPIQTEEPATKAPEDEMDKDISSPDDESASEDDETIGEEMVFDQASLASYNGKDGMPAYVAVDGVVYDVSDVESWQGAHRNQFEPGKDYSELITKSPHGKKVLDDLPVVGTYQE